jgi:hypothetical protein
MLAILAQRALCRNSALIGAGAKIRANNFTLLMDF